MRTLYKNTLNHGDIEVTDGTITSIGEVRSESDEEFDCTGLIAWPGLVDSHVHFRTPGQEYKEDWVSGSAAARAGGITTVLDMPNNAVPITNATLLAKKRAVIDASTTIGYKLAITPTNDTMDDFMAAEPQADAIKLFMGSTTGNIVITDREAIKQVFRDTTKPLMIHAESEDIVRKNEELYKDQDEPQVHSAIRGREAAIAAVAEALDLAKEFEREIYLCHVTTAEELELVREARKNGVRVYVEVTPHHLVLNTSVYEDLNNYARVNPPLRTNKDNTALWEGISDGTVSVVATDHAPHTKEEKEQSYWDAPSGVPGIEFMFPLLLTAVSEGKIDLSDVKRCVLENPAKVFGLAKQIAVGKPADMVLFSLDESWVVGRDDIKSKAGWSPYLGYRMVGKVMHTVKTV